MKQELLVSFRAMHWYSRIEGGVEDGSGLESSGLAEQCVCTW